MVDDLDIARISQATIAASTTPGPLSALQAAQAAALAKSSDSVDLSAPARDIVAESSGRKSIAEAWLDQKIKPPDLTDPDSLQSRPNLFDEVNTSTEEDDKAGQRSLKRAFNTALSDISWLIDALGVGNYDAAKVAEMVAHRAAADGVGVRPPVSTVIAQAEQSGSTAALYVEGLSVTLQKGKTVDSSVDRVAITTVNPSMSASLTGNGRPMVLDVGGELQAIAAPAMNEAGNDIAQTAQALTPQARASQAAKVAEILLATSMQRADDPRHALLIIREGGKLYPEGTMKLKMDVLQPIR